MGNYILRRTEAGCWSGAVVAAGGQLRSPTGRGGWRVLQVHNPLANEGQGLFIGMIAGQGGHLPRPPGVQPVPKFASLGVARPNQFAPRGPDPSLAGVGPIN